jgi:hypothetical protein
MLTKEKTFNFVIILTTLFPCISWEIWNVMWYVAIVTYSISFLLSFVCSFYDITFINMINSSAKFVNGNSFCILLFNIHKHKSP